MNIEKQKLSFLLIIVIAFAVLLFSKDVVASAGQITDSDEVVWGLSTGKFKVNGIPAFCAQYVKKRPYTGVEVKEIIPCTNEIMRKALYYGFNGPQNKLGTDEKAYVLTAIALSDANIGEAETGVKAQYDAFYWELVNNPNQYPNPPASFKTYFAITASDAMQNLVFYEIAKPGYAKAIKISSDDSVSNGNNCYSLEGAKYGIYKSSALQEKDRVGTWTTDKNGNTNTIELEAGTYYVKEIEAPKGYQLSKETVRMDITEGNTTTLNLKDDPDTVDIDLLIQKIDAETLEDKPQGDASLKGAQFLVRFYATYFETDISGLPTRSWVFETDEKGSIHYNEQYKVSGDDLYASLPLGTLTIHEVKPSEGYKINSTMYVKRIERNTTFQYQKVEEQVIKVKVYKSQEGTEIPLSGVLFEHSKPDGRKEIICTNEEGVLVFSGVNYGEHKLREICAADGYTLNPQEYTFYVDDTTTEDIEMKIYNKANPYNVVIYKSDEFQNALEGVEFVLYKDAECKHEISRGTTDANGVLRLANLEIGTIYYLKETKTPAGYLIPVGKDGEPILYKIYANSIPSKGIFEVYIDDVLQETQYDETKQTQEVEIQISNNVDFILPQTGTYTRLLMTITGTLCCAMGLYLILEKRRKTYEKN